MPNHEYFEELAAIAALGELDPSQLRDLNLHLAACARCKQVSDEYTVLHAARPTLGGDMIDVVESRRETVKAAFLQQIATPSIAADQNLERADKSPALRRLSSPKSFVSSFTVSMSCFGGSACRSPAGGAEAV